MQKLFSVLLLSAILSQTFTPCFAEERKFNEEISSIPFAEPADFYEEETSEKQISNNQSNENLTSEENNLTKEEKNTNINSDNINLVDNENIEGCPITVQRNGTVEAFKSAYKCLAGKELEATILEKGRKFDVKSMQSMSYETTGGAEIKFESMYPERVFTDKAPVKLVFTGEIVKNKPPGKLGSSGTLKVMIKNVKLENITYPAEAYITKMNKKGVLLGAVAGPSNYKDNLADAVNTGTIHTIFKDPCKTTADECVSTVTKPFYFLTGALLQTADLFIAPIVALFLPGNEVVIPEGTEFEIKLENDIPVLEI